MSRAFHQEPELESFMLTHAHQVIVFRHGETDWNREGRIQGATDIPMNADGVAQARLLGTRLQGLGLAQIVTSDLSRASETARQVSAVLGIPVMALPELREISYGVGEGRLVSEMRARFGDAFYARWRGFAAGDWDVGFPGGETKRVVLERSRRGIERVLREQGCSCLGVSTHGGILRVLAHACLPEDAPTIAISNCIAYRFEVLCEGGVPARWIFGGVVPGTADVEPKAAERV
jgi:broad specificity phosphatase PhoE